MNLADRLIRQLDARGLKVLPGGKPGELLLAGPAVERTPEVMAALKEFKPLLLERFARVAEPDLPADDARPDALALPVAQPETPADPQPVPRA